MDLTHSISGGFRIILAGPLVALFAIGTASPPVPIRMSRLRALRVGRFPLLIQGICHASEDAAV